MRASKWVLLSSFVLFHTQAAYAGSCNSEALGTSRVMSVPFSQGPVGRANYKRTLPLERGEVVLTFDDGPMPHRTPAVLDALSKECVQATFFVVGTMIAEYPEILRRTAAEGHTIATHTWSHSYLNKERASDKQRDQISGGLSAARAVLGDSNAALSPFFRFPGLGNTAALDRYVADQHLIPFSIDVEGDDWKRISPEQVMERILLRLKVNGRGIILLHDIQPRTVTMLPELLRRLKTQGYRVVHVVPEPEDTRIALNTIETLQAKHIQVALNRLDTKMEAIRLASREHGPVAIETVAAAMVNGAAAPKPPVQVASADFDLLTLRSTINTARSFPPVSQEEPSALPRVSGERGVLSTEGILVKTTNKNAGTLSFKSDVNVEVVAASSSVLSARPPLEVRKAEYKITEPKEKPAVRSWDEPPIRPQPSSKPLIVVAPGLPDTNPGSAKQQARMVSVETGTDISTVQPAASKPSAGPASLPVVGDTALAVTGPKRSTESLQPSPGGWQQNQRSGGSSAHPDTILATRAMDTAAVPLGGASRAKASPDATRTASISDVTASPPSPTALSTGANSSGKQSPPISATAQVNVAPVPAVERSPSNRFIVLAVAPESRARFQEISLQR